MPIYDLECSKCKEVVEIQCSSKDRNKQKCDKCGGKLKQLFLSMPIVHLGLGYHTRLSDIAPDKDASQEVKDNFNKHLKVRRRNPLNIRTSD